MTVDSEYRVLVCGGRKYENALAVHDALATVWIISTGVLVVIEGGANGADKHARKWAERHDGFGVRHLPFPAKWRENGHYNAGAGLERNTKMLVEGKPNLVIAFPGNRGTRDMVKKSKAAGVPVVQGEDIEAVKEAAISYALSAR